jgi:hypothetical protein
MEVIHSGARVCRGAMRALRWGNEGSRIEKMKNKRIRKEVESWRSAQ